MFKFIANMFSHTPTKFNAKLLQDARTQQAHHRAAAEYHDSQVSFYTKRIARLTTEEVPA